MAERVRARRLSDVEGQQLQQIVRRGKHGSIRVRRALIVMAPVRLPATYHRTHGIRYFHGCNSLGDDKLQA